MESINSWWWPTHTQYHQPLHIPHPHPQPLKKCARLDVGWNSRIVRPWSLSTWLVMQGSWFDSRSIQRFCLLQKVIKNTIIYQEKHDQDILEHWEVKAWNSLASISLKFVQWLDKSRVKYPLMRSQWNRSIKIFRPYWVM